MANTSSLLDKIVIGNGVEFERVRRITGYLSTVKRFNNAKRAELNDRVKHSLSTCNHTCCAA